MNKKRESVNSQQGENNNTNRTVNNRRRKKRGCGCGKKIKQE